jgi:hypothetical protein
MKSYRSMLASSQHFRLDRNSCIRIHPKAGLVLDLAPESLPELIGQALNEHDRLIASGGPSVLKNAPESAVTRVNLANWPPVCVKELRFRGPMHALKSVLRATQGTRTFANGWRLNEAGFPAAYPLALIQKKRLNLVTGEWIVMEVIPRSVELDRYLVHRIGTNWSPEEKKGLARLMGRYVGSLHSAGIFHSDLKTCNILVSEIRGGPEEVKQSGPWRPTDSAGTLCFSLVDYDDVTFSDIVSTKKRIKNLVQIFLSMPTAVTACDRLRFLHEYALHVGLSPAERRKTALRVLKAARGKEILYVGFDGDIVEKWDWRRKSD